MTEKKPGVNTMALSAIRIANQNSVRALAQSDEIRRQVAGLRSQVAALQLQMTEIQNQIGRLEHTLYSLLEIEPVENPDI